MSQTAPGLGSPPPSLPPRTPALQHVRVTTRILPSLAGESDPRRPPFSCPSEPHDCRTGHARAHHRPCVSLYTPPPFSVPASKDTRAELRSEKRTEVVLVVPGWQGRDPLARTRLLVSSPPLILPSSRPDWATGGRSLPPSVSRSHSRRLAPPVRPLGFPPLVTVWISVYSQTERVAPVYPSPAPQTFCHRLPSRDFSCQVHMHTSFARDYSHAIYV